MLLLLLRGLCGLDYVFAIGSLKACKPKEWRHSVPFGSEG